MSPENIEKQTKLCPTCGTRLNEGASRCLVCGSELTVNPETGGEPGRTLRDSRMPEISLSLPAAIGLLAAFFSHWRRDGLFRPTAHRSGGRPNANAHLNVDHDPFHDTYAGNTDSYGYSFTDSDSLYLHRQVWGYVRGNCGRIRGFRAKHCASEQFTR